MSSKKDTVFKWYDPLIFYILIPVLALFIKLLFFSCRLLKVEGIDLDNKTLEESGGKAVYCSWHQRLVYHPYYISKSNRNLTVMVSQSRDGELATRLVSFFGLDTVRGSSTRGGISALKDLTKKLIDEETCGGMVVDGPLGPPRVAKMGAVILARDSRTPLIPVTWGADRCWVTNSWDRLIIPKPFARIVYCHSEPIWVPESAEGDELEKYKKLLEDSLNNAAKWCDEQLGEERPWRKIKNNDIPETGPVKHT